MRPYFSAFLQSWKFMCIKHKFITCIYFMLRRLYTVFLYAFLSHKNTLEKSSGFSLCIFSIFINKAGVCFLDCRRGRTQGGVVSLLQIRYTHRKFSSWLSFACACVMLIICCFDSPDSFSQAKKIYKQNKNELKTNLSI